MQNKKNQLTRRDFIRGTLGATLGTSILGVKWSERDERAIRSSLVVLVRDKNVLDADMTVDPNVLKKNKCETHSLGFET